MIAHGDAVRVDFGSPAALEASPGNVLVPFGRLPTDVVSKIAAGIRLVAGT